MLKTITILAMSIFVLQINPVSVLASSGDDVKITTEIESEREALRVDYEEKLKRISSQLCSNIDPSEIRFGGFILPFTAEDAPGEDKALKEPGNGAIVQQVLNEEASGDLKGGDFIISFDGISIDSAEHLRNTAYDSRHVTNPYIRFRRDGVEKFTRVGVAGDKFYLPFRLSMESGEISSFLTGHEGIIGSAMVHFVENDDQLAFILAHEIAHYIRNDKRTSVRDIRKDSSDAVAQGIVKAAFKTLLDYDSGYTPVSHNYITGPYQPVDEIAADKYALRLMQKAGYDADAGFDILGRIHAELKDSKNRYSKTYDQIHPVDLNRIALLDDALEQNEETQPLRQVTDKRQIILREFGNQLGSTNNPAVDHSEFWLTDAEIWPAPGLIEEGKGHIFFPWEIDRIAWVGVIKESYQLFEVGWISAELIDPKGLSRSKCKNSYAVTPPCQAACTMNLKQIPSEELEGVWTVKVQRSDTLIDERKIYFSKRLIPKRVIGKRSEILKNAAMSK